MSRGHLPLRSCIVCNSKIDKRDLIRLVRTQTGRVEVDATGKVPGRGAYLCHNQSCWEGALKKNRLEHTLRGPVSPQERIELSQYSKGLSESS